MAATFLYTGYKSTGAKVSGKLQADSREAAVMELERKDIVIVELTQSQDVEIDLQGALDKIFPPSVKVEDLIIFCRQMNALTRAGVPLMRALKGLCDSVQSRTLRNALIGVRNHVDQGSSLASALEQYPNIFGNIFFIKLYFVFFSKF